MPEIVYTQDVRLVGCTDIASAASESRLVLTNPLRKTLVSVGIAGAGPNVASASILVQAESEALPAAPKVVTSDDSYVYALGVDTLYRVTNSATALDAADFDVSTFAVDCPTPVWIVAQNGYVYFPYQAGGVAVYTNAGALVRNYGAVLDCITHAAVSLDGTIFYFFDGTAGRAIACVIGADGLLAAEPPFDATNCKDIVAVVPDTTYIAVACRHRINLFTIEDQTQPVFLGAGRYEFELNDMVRVAADSWWVASDTYVEAQEDRFNFKNEFAGYLASKGVVAVSAHSGRVVCAADFVSFRPDTVYTPPPVSGDTDYLLQEDGSLLLTESGDMLEWE